MPFQDVAEQVCVPGAALVVRLHVEVARDGVDKLGRRQWEPVRRASGVEAGVPSLRLAVERIAKPRAYVVGMSREPEPVEGALHPGPDGQAGRVTRSVDQDSPRPPYRSSRSRRESARSMRLAM